MPQTEVVTDDEDCKHEEKQNVIGCTAFVTEKANGPYMCWSGCQIEKPEKALENLDEEAKGSTGYLYIHKDIFSAWN